MQCALHQLMQRSLVFRFQDIYSLRDDIDFVQKHQKNAAREVNFRYSLLRIANKISMLPFVRCIGYIPGAAFNGDGRVEEGSLLVIAAHNYYRFVTLWIAKLNLLLPHSKLNPLRIEIVDEAQPFVNQNLVTATTLLSIEPLHGAESFSCLIKANNWVRPIFPNNYLRVIKAPNISRNRVKRIVEWVVVKCLQMFPQPTESNPRDSDSLLKNRLLQENFLQEYSKHRDAVWKKYKAAIRCRTERWS
ncbi:MAG: hypothetical protein JWQ27_950 [Ferruginibacter sp.]|nr:hypothetical protein [Ferruginibacter sp.]